MKFVHPNILYFLLLLSIPIIIHLFNFRRYKKLYFSSLIFIKKVEKETSTTKKLRHYIILACRLLAFTALIFAFAQPYIPKNEQSKSYSNVVPIYLDNSMSMSAKGSNGDLLNQAKASVRRIVENYPLEQNYLLITNNMSGDEHRLITRSELEDKLEYIDLSPLSRSLVSPLESSNEYLESINYDGDKQYYLISDFQSHILDKTEAEIDTNAFYSIIQLEPQIKENLYIDSVWFDQTFRRVNMNNALNIRIQNTGLKELTNVELSLTINGNRRQTLTDLNANGSTIATINYTDKTPGIKEGVVELIDQNIYFDNHYHFSYNVDTGIEVLIINGNENINYPSLVYKNDDFYQVNQTSIDHLKTDELSKANLIVLNGVRSISSGIQTQLEHLVEQGIYLLIIPANNMEIESYNNLLGGFQLPLFKSVVGQDIRIGEILSENEFFYGMFDENVKRINMPPLKKYISSSTYTNANYLALVQYENNMPLVAINAENKRVFALYSAIHPEFNDFGKSALFSSLLLRIGELSQGNPPLSLTLGSSDTYTLKNTIQNEAAVILKQDELEFIPEMTKDKGGFISISAQKLMDNTNIRDGIFNILNRDENLGKVAFNYNRIESDMQYASKDDLQKYMNTLGIKHYVTREINNINDIQKLDINKPLEYWRILLILAIVFFILEMAVIKFWKV